MGSVLEFVLGSLWLLLMRVPLAYLRLLWRTLFPARKSLVNVSLIVCRMFSLSISSRMKPPGGAL